MSASQGSVVIDFNEFKRRQRARARAEAPAAAPAPPAMLWCPCPVMVMMPVVWWYVPQQGQDHATPR